MVVFKKGEPIFFIFQCKFIKNNLACILTQNLNAFILHVIFQKCLFQYISGIFLKKFFIFIPLNNLNILHLPFFNNKQFYDEVFFHSGNVSRDDIAGSKSPI